MNGFSQALRGAREGNGLSQRALARACGLTPAYMSLLEGGRRRPERGTVERIALALSLDDAKRDGLLLAAGFAAGASPRTAATGPLAEVQAALEAPGITPEQREALASLVVLYARGLAERARAGKPLVADLAGSWQARVLEAVEEKIAENAESIRATYERPLFDL